MASAGNDKIMGELKEDSKKLGIYGVRHTLALMCFLGYLIVFAMRVSLSIAIVAMTNSTNANHTEDHNNNNTCPYPPSNDDDTDSAFSNGEFNWSEPTKGLLLGAFYYGYILTNIIGGRAADYWGGRYVNGCSIILASLCMIASPAAAGVSSTLLVVIRILQGIAAGLGFPAMTSLIAKWYPKNERSKFAAFILSSNQLGTVVSMGVSGWLCGSEKLGGWPSVFYVFGSLGLVWGVFWFLLIKENPASHPRISDQELKYIIKGCPPITEQIPVPWLSIFSSKPFWSIVAGHFGIAWTSLTLLAELPTYLNNILHVKIENNGILSALPFLGSWLFSMVLSFSLNTLVVKKVITLLSMRKISMVFAGYLPAIGAICLCFTNCNKTLALSIFAVLGTCLGGQFTGCIISHADITPRFAGTAMGLTNTFACVAGFLSPLIASYVTDGNQTISAWNIVFIIFAVVSIVSTSIYIYWITTEVQAWNYPKKEDSPTSGKECEKSENLCDSKKISFANDTKAYFDDTKEFCC